MLTQAFVFPNTLSGTPKGLHFQSSTIEVFKNILNPSEGNGCNYPSLSLLRKKRICECPSKWENDTNGIVTENGSINPSFQNDVQRCLRPKEVIKTVNTNNSSTRRKFLMESGRGSGTNNQGKADQR